MTRAEIRGAKLRRKLGLTGRVDAFGVANILGYRVERLDLKVQKELEVDGVIGIAERLGPEECRWYIAHALGHKMLHPGNHLWIYRNTWLGPKYEREANDFAYRLLTDEWEAIAEGLTCSQEVADLFGVPGEFVRVQSPLAIP